jgi:hypothetical protein
VSSGSLIANSHTMCVASGGTSALKLLLWGTRKGVEDGHVEG